MGIGVKNHAHRFGKPRPSFWKTMGIGVENHGHGFLLAWAWKFITTGNEIYTKAWLAKSLLVAMECLYLRSWKFVY